MKFTTAKFSSAKRALSKKHPEISSLLKRHKVKFEPMMKRTPYESLVRAIAHQQLHGKAAETILARFLSLFAYQKFPKPELIIQIGYEKIRACGFSHNKTKSILDIAQKAVNGTIPTSRQIHKLSNEEIIQRLTQIYGVGQWTVEMLLIFQLGRLDVWPVDDFGVRKGYQVWRRKKEMPTAKDLRLVRDEFHPYQSVMALHLWREADLAKLKKLKPRKK